jgi:hypothetical protein
MPLVGAAQYPASPTSATRPRDPAVEIDLAGRGNVEVVCVGHRVQQPGCLPAMVGVRGSHGPLLLMAVAPVQSGRGGGERETELFHLASASEDEDLHGLDQGGGP